MCGRYTLTSPDELLEEFGVDELPPGLEPRFNVAPTQSVPVVLVRDGRRVIELVRWGLVPPWAEDTRIGNRLINARAESAHRKPAFRKAFAERRCLVAADGFYEWRRDGKRKTPFYIRRRDHRPMAFAGLWERWRSEKEGDWLLSCTILTTDANDLVRPLHDRMPVLIPRGDRDRWLSAEIEEREPIADLLAPPPDGVLECYEVSTDVNSPRRDDASLIEPGPRQGQLL